MVLEPPAPVRRHARVRLGQHGDEILELVGRHRRAHADLFGHVDRDLQRHLVDDRLKNQVLTLLAERLHLLRPHHDARTVLGIDDGVTLLELHAEPSRREKSGTLQDTARWPESDGDHPTRSSPTRPHPSSGRGVLLSAAAAEGPPRCRDGGTRWVVGANRVRRGRRRRRRRAGGVGDRRGDLGTRAGRHRLGARLHRQPRRRRRG